MCNPALAIGGVLGGLQAVSTFNQAKAAHESQVEAYMGNIDAATQAKVEADRQLRLNQAQSEEKAAQEKISNELQSMRLQSKARQAQSETGAISNSNAIIQDMARQGLVANNMISANIAREQAQRNESFHTQRSNYQSRINAVARPEWDQGAVLTTSLLSGASTGLMAAGAAGAAGVSTSGGFSSFLAKPPV
jgi:ATPase subunit of ABC transporter with duplicated ATPase domains